MRKLLLLLLVLLAALLACSSARADLVLAENGACPYQIVIPDKAADEIVDNWLLGTAKLMQAAFEKNGFKVEVVREGARAADKPGIYLGATKFAEKHGVKVEQFNDWTYCQKAAGKDVVIAGNDKKDPVKTIQGSGTPLALLGTVKGACDFLRQYVGVRFLFLNVDAGPCRLNENGSLKLDPRSIAFIPVGRIAVPENLDLKKTPMLRACADGNYETFYHIANNFFPLLSFVQGKWVYWNKVIPLAKYGPSHPEYFALLGNGKRACERDFTFSSDEIAQQESPLCPMHPEVQDLIFRAAEKLFLGGDSIIGIFPPDSFRLCQCNCERCLRLFGAEAKGWKDLYARGRSGKLWQAYFAITERVRQKYPQARIVLWDYQDTPIQTVKEFPENVIPQLQIGKPADFEKLNDLRIPAGICGLEETFTGFGWGGPFAPERTPEYAAGLVQAMARNNVQWTTRDGAIGYVRGLQAPAYYVYGRMMDDPSADWRSLLEEFCAAAFGHAAWNMTAFYDRLHEQIALYSDFLGIFMPAEGRKYAGSRFRDNKWHIQSIYTPKFVAEANMFLTNADHQTKNDPDVRARLHLIRIEFDYLCELSKIFTLQDVWTLQPTPDNLTALLDAIDAWYARLEGLARGTGNEGFKPLDDWPEICPFAYHTYKHATLQDEGYHKLWYLTSLGWDRAAIRDGILTNPPRLQVATVAETPAIDAAAWEQVSAVVFRQRGDMPYTKVRTTLKALRDRDHLYVRLDCRYPSRSPKDMPEPKTESDVLKQEYVELGIRPAADGPVYRLAANPTAGARFDAAWKPDAQNRLTEDRQWNGRWQFDYRATGDTWTGWFRIPFAELGGAAPTAGETWGFNAARNWIRDSGDRYLLWRDASSVTDPQALGWLVF